jgi:hypothetical protein
MKAKTLAIVLLCCVGAAILARPNVPPQPIIHFSNVAMKGLIRETLDEWWEDAMNAPVNPIGITYETPGLYKLLTGDPNED